MSGKRKAGEGSWSVVTIKGQKYKRYRTAEGKQFYAKTEKEVQAKYKKWIIENAAYSHIKDSELTLSKFADIWLVSKRMQVKQSTYDGYEYFVWCIDNPHPGELYLGCIPMKEMNKKIVQQYIDSWVNCYPKSTIKKYKALLSNMFQMAVEDEIIPDNYVRYARMPIDEAITKKSKPHVFLSTNDRKKLENEQLRTYPTGTLIYGNNARAIVFLLHTGLRVGELIALKWRNVDFENKNIFVIENAPMVKNRDPKIDKKRVVLETTTKRISSERYVPLSNKALEILEYLYENKPHEPDNLVFTTNTGNYMDRSTLNRTLKKMLVTADCEVQNASIHDLRHSFGSELIKLGTDVKVVSELLGHKDIQTTYNIYIHILSEQKISAIDLFNKFD